MKKRDAIAISLLVLLALPMSVFASTSYVEYAGQGAITIETTSSSMGNPDVVDTATVCAGDCQCTGECENECQYDCSGGSYDGYQYVANGYYTLTNDYTNVDNGCAEHNQTILNNLDGRVVTSTFDTGIHGTGTAYSYLQSDSSRTFEYQKSNGTGTMWAYTEQTNVNDSEVKTKLSYGGMIEDCDNGNVTMMSYSEINGSTITYDPVWLSVVCGSGDQYTWLYAESSEMFQLCSRYYTEYAMNDVNVTNIGTVDYKFSAQSNSWFEFIFSLIFG